MSPAIIAVIVIALLSWVMFIRRLHSSALTTKNGIKHAALCVTVVFVVVVLLLSAARVRVGVVGVILIALCGAGLFYCVERKRRSTGSLLELLTVSFLLGYGFIGSVLYLCAFIGNVNWCWFALAPMACLGMLRLDSEMTAFCWPVVRWPRLFTPSVFLCGIFLLSIACGIVIVGFESCSMPIWHDDARNLFAFKAKAIYLAGSLWIPEFLDPYVQHQAPTRPLGGVMVQVFYCLLADGYDDWSIQFLRPCFHAVTIGLLFVYTRRATNTGMALFAGGLFAVMPFVLGQTADGGRSAVSADYDYVQATFLLGSGVVAFEALERRRMVMWVVASLISGFGVLIKDEGFGYWCLIGTSYLVWAIREKGEAWRVKGQRLALYLGTGLMISLVPSMFATRMHPAQTPTSATHAGKLSPKVVISNLREAPLVARQLGEELLAVNKTQLFWLMFVVVTVWAWRWSISQRGLFLVFVLVSQVLVFGCVFLTVNAEIGRAVALTIGDGNQITGLMGQILPLAVFVCCLQCAQLDLLPSETVVP